MSYIWKEWFEQTRGKGLWLGLLMLGVTSVFLIGEARGFPEDLGFEALLMSLFDMSIYLIPLFTMFLASFSIYQEKELKTAMILLTKKESVWSFLFRKSIAVQTVLLGTFLGVYFILAIFMKIFLDFHLSSFLYFILVITVFIVIFTQVGVFLGSISQTKMQLIGLTILTWFLLVFLIDLVFLYVLPAISFETIRLFSWAYFLDPLHTLRFYLETKLGLFGLTNMSQLMEKFVFMDAWKILSINIVVWPGLFFQLSGLLYKRGDSHD